MKKLAQFCLICTLSAFPLAAQMEQDPNHPPGLGPGPGMMRPNRPPMNHGVRGKWWSDPEIVRRLALTDDQQKRIEEIFEKSRLRLIDLSAALEKEDAILEPLLSVDHPDEAKVIAQIDRVAQARAELEKANARMLLGFRGVLTPEQWKRLQDSDPRRNRPPGQPGFNGPPPRDNRP